MGAVGIDARWVTLGVRFLPWAVAGAHRTLGPVESRPVVTCVCSAVPRPISRRRTGTTRRGRREKSLPGDGRGPRMRPPNSSEARSRLVSAPNRSARLSGASATVSAMFERTPEDVAAAIADARRYDPETRSAGSRIAAMLPSHSGRANHGSTVFAALRSTTARLPVISGRFSSVVGALIRSRTLKWRIGVATRRTTAENLPIRQVLQEDRSSYLRVGATP